MAIGWFLPFPEVPGIKPRLDWLAKHGDDFDVIVIGSSHVDLQFIPSAFDSAAAALGCPVRSFNAGASAMTPPEDYYVIEQILRRPHRRLRWVFLELMPFRAEYNPLLLGTERMDYWHDARRMWLFNRRLCTDISKLRPMFAIDSRKWCDRMGSLFFNWGKHLNGFALRTVNYGRGTVLLSEFLGGETPHSRYDNGGPLGDGWVAPWGPQNMRDNVEDYQRRLEAMRKDPPARVEGGLDQETLDQMIDRLGREGVKTILFLSPAIMRLQFHPAPQTLERAPLFDLFDVDRNREFYDLPNRLDVTHLNLTGADLFSRKLATLFAAYVKSNPR